MIRPALAALLDVLPPDGWLDADQLAERAAAAGLPIDRSTDPTTYDGHPFDQALRHLRRKGLVRSRHGSYQRTPARTHPTGRHSDTATPRGHHQR